MAVALNTNPQTWQVYESGKSVPGGKVLEALARMGINVNWVLTGVGPMKLHKDEIKRAICEEAHEELKKQANKIIHSRPASYYEIPDLTIDQIKAYIQGEYMLTKNQLVELCKKSGARFFDDEFIQNVTSVDLNTSSKATPEPIDEELLKLAIEVVEEIKYGDGPGLPSTKAALISLVYVMNSGSNYNKERLIRFIEAVCTLINQGVDINKLSERKLNNLVVKIAHHVVKGGE